jgi:hypothetical protein
MSGPLNSSKPSTSEIVGAVYNATPPAPTDGQPVALQSDSAGNLKVNVVTGSTGNVNIAQIGGVAESLSNPLPVELSDGTNSFGTSANPITVNANAGTGTFTVGGTVTANQGSPPWSQRIQDGASSTLATVTASNALKVDGSAVTQPVSGTVTANTNITQIGGVAESITNPLPVRLSDGTNPFGTSGNPLSGNVSQWGGTSVASASTTALDGTGALPSVRQIPTRNGRILTTTPLGANAAYISPWFDTNQDGTSNVTASVYTNQPGTFFGIEESDDTSSANFQDNVTQLNSVSANSLQSITGDIFRRYWRVHYINSTTAQTVFEITVSPNSLYRVTYGISNGVVRPVYVDSSGALGIGISTSGISYDNQRIDPIIGNGIVRPMGAAQMALESTPSSPSGQQVWVEVRTPSVFKTTTATVSGNTVVWTPTSGKKFRLMRYIIQIPQNAAASAAADLEITFQDATTSIGVGHSCFIPSTAATTFGSGYSSGWIDLGNGYLSAAANNVLNINLSFALTSGEVRVTVCGAEE